MAFFSSSHISKALTFGRGTQNENPPLDLRPQERVKLLSHYLNGVLTGVGI